MGRFASALSRTLLVAAGGALGVLARWALSHLLGPTFSFTGIPVEIFIINITGAILLGALSGWLSRRAATARRENWRLFIGPGILGGYTTYSALAVGTAELFLAGDAARALVYSLGTVVLGLLATALGWAAGAGRAAPAGSPESGAL